MTVSNHILAGSAIALTFKQPLIVLPLAFLSHFLLDAVPHFGYSRGGYKEIFTHKLSYAVLFLDIVGIAAVISTFVFASWLTFAAALIALLPDVVWPYRYFYYERNEIQEAMYRFTRFHEKIQWCERSWGIVVEVPLFVLGFVLLHSI